MLERAWYNHFKDRVCKYYDMKHVWAGNIPTQILSKFIQKTVVTKITQKTETFKNICAAQHPTAKTRQFKLNSMRATLSKNCNECTLRRV